MLCYSNSLDSSSMINISFEDKFDREKHFSDRSNSNLELKYYIPKIFSIYLQIMPNPDIPVSESHPIPDDEELQIVKQPIESQKIQTIAWFFFKRIHPEYEHLTFEELIELLKEESRIIEEEKLKQTMLAKDPKAARKAAT